MKNIHVKTSMSQNLKTIHWDASMQEAYRLMEEYRIRHLPVVDSEKLVVGILSERDVNRAMNPNRPGFAPECFVSDFMSWPVITADEKRPLKDVAECMVTEKISAVLVTNSDNNVVGIITSEDLLRFLMDAMGTEKKKSLLDFAYTPLVRELMQETQSAGL